MADGLKVVLHFQVAKNLKSYILGHRKLDEIQIPMPYNKVY